ncbi:hypothetical protein E6R60_26860 [Streptomyces sp. A0642]|uniref:hypothetical protein n=1 Tax=Streptomyces sp. A0642 TaxID=2563100 RepID=UPI0010A29732|nr:hypothetical protein [Streptomyces sp. A0642]THA72552.1 hypothetical protein E6R60_26860 [Streptomyces sp. A0642]
MPQNNSEARTEAALSRMSRLFRRASQHPGASPEEAEMRANRRMRKRAAVGGGAGGSSPQVSFATARPRDPLFYWRQNNMPFQFDDPAQMQKMRAYCRLVYASHPIVGSCVDIYSKYPLLGMKMSCKDERLTEFYTQHFLTKDGLDYNKFLVDLGREYWTVGEAWPLGTFNEQLGVWDTEELLNPDDVEVQPSPFLRDPRFLIRLPTQMRELIRTRQPVWEYAKLMEAYPELTYYADDNSLMPVSNILLRQLKFEADTFNRRGIPLLYRAMRSLMQEEMLNTAVDSIADRLYMPIILAKLGASASDLGTQVPWIPTQDDLADFEEAVDTALAGDFRIILSHFGVEMEAVLGKEDMPDMSGEFERIEGRILQTFGLSKTMLAGASSGETYAADALNRDLVTQMLTNYQQLVNSHYRERALVVAEAQEHFDYEERGGRRYVKMEEVFEIDEESGEERIVEQPKLLIPDLQFRTMSLQDEAAQTEFFEALREAGVPISMRTRLHNVQIDLDDEVERARDEAVQLAVAEQETRKATYIALRDAGLPIPIDLRADFEPRALPEGQDPLQLQADGLRVPMLGLDPTGSQPTLAPTVQDLQTTPADGGVVEPGSVPEPVDADGGARPDESDEQRESMPKQSSLTAKSVLHRRAGRIRELANVHQPKVKIPAKQSAVEGEPEPEPPVAVQRRQPVGIYGDPRHIGMRRHIPKDEVQELQA